MSGEARELEQRERRRAMSRLMHDRWRNHV